MHITVKFDNVDLSLHTIIVSCSVLSWNIHFQHSLVLLSDLEKFAAEAYQTLSEDLVYHISIVQK